MKVIPECFYRVSVKALVLNGARDSFLVVQEEDGKWELPGGGLEWGESVTEGLAREIMEEMGVQTSYVAANPAYFFTFKNKLSTAWMANVVYITELESLDFIKSEECTEIKFINTENISNMKLTQNVKKLLEVFDSDLHKK